MRRAMLARRRAIHAERGAAAAVDGRTRLLEALPPQSRIIAGYWPLGDELDCRPALAGLCQRGLTIALPVVAGQGLVLIFRSWLEGEPMDSGPFGTSHPSARAPVVEPDTL